MPVKEGAWLQVLGVLRGPRRKGEGGEQKLRGQAWLPGGRRWEGLRNGTLLPAAESGAPRLLPSCPDHSPPPTSEGSGRTEAATGLRKACLLGRRACAMAYRADSNVSGVQGQEERESRWGLLGAGSPTARLPLPHGCGAGTRGLSRGHPPRGHRASILGPLEPRPCAPDHHSAGTWGPGLVTPPPSREGQRGSSYGHIWPPQHHLKPPQP